MENPYQMQNLLFENAPVLTREMKMYKHWTRSNIWDKHYKVYNYSESVNGSLVQKLKKKKKMSDWSSCFQCTRK